MSRFSFNQITAKLWDLPEMVAGCVAAGVDQVALWREPVAEYGLERSAALVRDAGLTVTTLCRSGFFQLPDWYDDNRRAIDEAAALNTPVLVLVSGACRTARRTWPARGSTWPTRSGGWRRTRPPPG